MPNTTQKTGLLVRSYTRINYQTRKISEYLNLVFRMPFKIRNFQELYFSCAVM